MHRPQLCQQAVKSTTEGPLAGQCNNLLNDGEALAEGGEIVLQCVLNLLDLLLQTFLKLHMHLQKLRSDILKEPPAQ